MSKATQIAELLRKANHATTLSEQREFVRQAELLKSEQHTAALGSGDWSAEDAHINDTLVPAPVHERVTAATDWLMDLDESVDPRQASQQMVAEASLWFGRVSDDVKSYGDEYSEQAKNLARRLAGQFGDAAEAAERAFLDEANRLRSTAVRSGIVVEADAGETPPENKGPKQKAWDKLAEGDLDREKDGDTKSFENKAASYEDTAAEPSDDEETDDDDQDNPFATTGMIKAAAHEQQSNDLYAVLTAQGAAEDMNGITGNPGVYNDNPQLTRSDRAPALQELNSTSQDVVPVNDPGLGQTDDKTSENASRTGEQDYASKESFPVHGKKESTQMANYASCPTCGGHGRVAVRARQLPAFEDIFKVGVSGLDQIDQIVDPHDNGPASTPYPADVAFPWVLNPQGQIPAAIQQAEEQIAQRNSLSPTQQSRSQQPTQPPRPQTRASVTAGGRDNSGWLGDNGARGLDYPGEQVGQYPAPADSGAPNYVDPAHGYGGDVDANRPAKPYGAAEADDYTNNPGMNWQPGQDTHADQGWREILSQDPALQAAQAYLQQRRAAYERNGR